jgi:hypothetical protein
MFRSFGILMSGFCLVKIFLGQLVRYWITQTSFIGIPKNFDYGYHFVLPVSDFPAFSVSYFSVQLGRSA